jgi:polysaccharide biosynthesis/export protein
LPNQPIDTKGMISVPYAGLVPTAGKTPAEVEQEIVARIKNRAIEPQAVVALVNQNSSLITVIGEINSTITSPTGRIPAQPSGERILDVITRAGGMKDQGQDVWVVLERHGQRASAPFGSLIYEPGNNIWAWPGDTIYLYQEPQTYLAFGATGLQGQFKFSAGNQSQGFVASAWRMTLAEALAAAAGMIDVQADPGSVFLFRREPRELAEKLGVDCSKMDGPTVPVVYTVSFVDPAGYFLATRMQMHNKDVLFAANAQSVDITKFATFLNTMLAVPQSVSTIGETISIWRVETAIR